MNPPRHRPQRHVLTRALLLVHRDKIEPYLRDTFDVHKSVKKIGVKIFISVQEEVKFVTTVRDPSTQDGFFGGTPHGTAPSPSRCDPS